MPVSLQWFLKPCHNIDEVDSAWFQARLQDGTLRAVCDDSFIPLLSTHNITASYIIESMDQLHNIRGNVAIAGNKADPY